MFGRRRVSKQVMFLLVMCCDKNDWDIPEFTLWENMEDALDAAAEAVINNKIDVDWTRFEEDVTIFMPECFEIIPITLSTPDFITWLGHKRSDTNE